MMKMWNFYKLFIVAVVVICLTACDEKPTSKRQEVLLQGKTMGTTFTVKVFVPVDKLQTLNLFSDVTDLLDDVNQSMSTYVQDSEINKFNRGPANKVFAMSADFRTVTAESIRIGKSTGTLDVTMGPLINLWGFGPDKKPTKIPSDELINNVKRQIGIDKLTLNGQGLSKSVDSLQISYSAIAKGFGIDKVAEYLNTNELTDYMVEIGGEIRTSGTKANGQPWVLAIEQPDAPVGERKAHKILKLSNISMATSGDYRIFYELDGERFTHLISPVTGKPVKQDLVSVTVLHPSAMTADGLATALTVMGTERAKDYAEQHGLPVYLISHTADGLTTYASSAFKPYL